MTDGKGGQPQTGSATQGFLQLLVLLSSPQHHLGNNPRPGTASSPAWEEGKGTGPWRRNQTRKEKKTCGALETSL